MLCSKTAKLKVEILGGTPQNFINVLVTMYGIFFFVKVLDCLPMVILCHLMGRLKFYSHILEFPEKIAAV